MVFEAALAHLEEEVGALPHVGAAPAASSPPLKTSVSMAHVIERTSRAMPACALRTVAGTLCCPFLSR